ncbi:hypothetical protein X989_4136 [Burkholderia pseudomallei MSHR4378]|nr:hypothetical protein X948_2246 [Burkholderia pseudomallei MSHR5608]KGS19557.1 hypothetical protein X989_4136 [Burkholderia pseudomallei MSHR4378]
MLLRCSRLQSNPGFERVVMNRPLLCVRRGALTIGSTTYGGLRRIR